MNDDDLQIRRDSWNRIRKITQSEIPDGAKLAACLNTADVYCALTGDDSLHPPAIREKHNAMIGEIPAAMASAKARERDRLTGQKSLF